MKTLKLFLAVDAAWHKAEQNWKRQGVSVGAYTAFKAGHKAALLDAKRAVLAAMEQNKPHRDPYEPSTDSLEHQWDEDLRAVTDALEAL